MNSTLRGTPQVPFSALVRDTVLTHGLDWAIAYYLARGVTRAELFIFLRAAKLPACYTL